MGPMSWTVAIRAVDRLIWAITIFATKTLKVGT